MTLDIWANLLTQVRGLQCQALALTVFFAFPDPITRQPLEPRLNPLHGEFTVEDEAPLTLRPGDTRYHAANPPHALTTTETGILAYVLWRRQLFTKPVWSHAGATA